jgi:hypothetical protein
MFQLEALSAKKCIVNDQLPAVNVVSLGTPLSVANVAITPDTPPPRIIFAVV